MIVKKVLFVNSGQSDYLEDLIFSGLNKILGRDNVVPFPVSCKYYFSRYKYPKNIAKTRNLLNYIHDKISVRKKIKKFGFDCVIVGSTKRDTFEAYNFIIDIVPYGIPVVYIDGGDRGEIGGDAKRLNFEPVFMESMAKRKIDIIFKREYLLNKEYPKNVFPLSFSYKGPSYNYGTFVKKYDVVFWAVASNSIREKAISLGLNKFDFRKNRTISGQKFKKYKRKGIFYLQELAAAKICYSFRGAGWDTLRYWEVPGVGSFMISGKPRIVIPDNFKAQKHLIFCKDDLSDLVDLTNYFLKNEKEREEIAKNGYNHLQKYHTFKKRTEYFLNILNETLTQDRKKINV